MKISGIYGIKNKVNHKIYIGQSNNINYRKNTHLRELKKGIHYNQHLQNSYNKHSRENFEFVILELCAAESLCENEQKWIDSLPREKLYNKNFYVYDLSGKRNPFFGKKHNETAKQKMADFKKNAYIGKGNPNYGKKCNLDTRIKMATNNTQTKLTKEQVLEIVALLKKNEFSHQEIANIYNIARTAITRISNGTRWANITGGPIIPITKINGVRQFSENHKKRIGQKRLGKKHSEETKTLMREIYLNRKKKES